MKKIIIYCVTCASAFASYGQGSGTNFTITTQPQSQIVPIGASATFSVGVTGAGPFTYQWQFDGSNLIAPQGNGIIRTVAGGGSTSPGDGGLATNAALSRPFSVAWDAQGDLLIADVFGDRVRSVNSSGIITTVAGTGAGSFSGDGGQATNATLDWPTCLTTDGLGNLYITEELNNRVRKVNASGIITTVAGGGTAGLGDGGAATNASLNSPQGVVFDAAGNMLIADFSNNRIRKVDTNGIITTVVGGGTSGLGDGGAATNATLDGPHGVTVDAAGEIFIADFFNNRIRKVDTNGIITTIAGTGRAAFSGDGGAATNATLNGPTDMTLDSAGNLLIADYGNSRVRKVGANGIITTVAGNGNATFSGDGGAATNASLNQPTRVGFDAYGNMFIADASNGRIREVLTPAGFTGPAFTLTGVTTNNAGNYTVIVSNSSQSVTSSVAVLQVNSLVMVNGKLAAGTVASVNSAQISFVDLFPSGFLFYTLDGSTPTTGSSLYFGAFTLTNSAIVQVLNVNSNDTQSVLSPQVTVEVGTSPVITMSPTNEVLAAGTELDLAVSAGGSPPLSYQWWNGSGAIAGATNANYDVASVGISDAGRYYAVVYNPYAAVTSAVATVTVYVPVSITQPPANQVARLGGTASFSVLAGAYPEPTYQWTFDSTNLPGATSDELTISNVQLTNLGSYAVLVSNAYSSQLTAPATLSMSPTITAPYNGATVIWGQNAVLSVGAIGTGPLSYQWFQNGVAIDGATNASFSLGSIQFTNGGLYTVVVSSPVGSVTNTPALLVVNPAGTSIGMYAGITLTGTTGYSYIIQYTTDLQSTNSWTTLTNLTLEQPVELWVDTSTNALTTPQRFYQVLPGQ
jgi:hypothetical protein